MKINYTLSGVNISEGDHASEKAYSNAKTTFPVRKGKKGEPFALDGGFTGALDMGDYLLVQNDDGTGTKTEIAERMSKYDTIGEDLACMVLDDAICVGAEVISLTNTFDVSQIDISVIDQMTQGLARVCAREQVVILGGEIAEVGTAVHRIVWNATAVGIVKKEKFITGKEIQKGQKIVGLRGRVLRSNGISLARKICEMQFGPLWHKAEWKNGISWGEILLTPSKIFHRLLLDTILGDFETPRIFPISGVIHITGGGIPGNVPRLFSDPKMGARFFNLHDPHDAVRDLQKLGDIDEEECYQTWNCGTALMIVCYEEIAEKICTALRKADNECDAKIVGEITKTGTIEMSSRFSGKKLLFPV